ncbi:MAG: hypothetical protein ACXAAT_20535 [Candidatus Hodarchaeales archaeon]|jgi:hypothetical protein
MAVTISLTLAKETEFFNENVKNRIHEEIRTTADLINATGGSTDKKAYHSLLSRYTKKSTSQILAGGKNTPFLCFFPVSDLTSFIIKPYHCRLEEIANHYVSVEDVNALYRNQKFEFGEKEIKIIFSDVFGLGTFTVEQMTIPFIIQRYSSGTKLTEIQSAEGRHIITVLPKVFRHLAKEGIIIDPYNQNWFMHGLSFDHRSLEYELLEYVDLAYMHSLETNHKVKAIIESLEPLR